jgi:CheY-like chemotaxis protein
VHAFAGRFDDPLGKEGHGRVLLVLQAEGRTGIAWRLAQFLVRTVAVEALIVAGFEVFEAGDGHEAVAHCAEKDIDLSFTDIQLPGEIDGWEIAKRCRQTHPMLPVVYATALARDESRAVPGSLLFRKPYTPDQLIGIVQTLTQQQ